MRSREISDSSTSKRERRLIVGGLAFGALCVVTALVGLVTLAGNDNRPPARADPIGTVRRFLTLTAGDNNGYQACRYLTIQEMGRAALAAGGTASCSQGFDSARLTLGGKTYNANDLKALTYSSVERDSSAVVTVSASGSPPLRFHLVPATAAEVNEFAAPPTDWRIDQGAPALIGL
jgi:hypothetical protein